MSVPPEYFARIAGSVNLPLLQSKLVVVVGIGTIGSQIAQELAKCGVGRFRLIDGDSLEEANRARHVLPERYVGMNKAEALTLHLAEEVPQSRPEALPRYVDGSVSDDTLDRFLEGADLIIAATDGSRRVKQWSDGTAGNRAEEIVITTGLRFPAVLLERLEGRGRLRVCVHPPNRTMQTCGVAVPCDR